MSENPLGPGPSILDAILVPGSTRDRTRAMGRVALYDGDGMPIDLAAGSQGPKGDTGPAGPVGPQGPKGDLGNTGAQGTAGAAGPKGDTGAQGPQGLLGPKGDKGDKGDPGPQGSVGATGTAGAVGATGPQGPAGIEGPQGDPGPEGPEGPEGPIGEVGPPGAPHVLPVVTALPASPIDGEEIFFKVNENLFWHLIYNLEATSPYRWLALGAVALRHYVQTSQQTSGGSGFVDLATPGPLLTLPLAGEYDLEWGAFGSLGAANYAFMAPKIGSAAVVPDEQAQFWGDTGANVEHRMWTVRREISSPNTVVKMQYYSPAASPAASFSYRFLKVTPVRLGG